MAKVKIVNKNKFDVGVKLINPVREQNIKAGSFAIVEEDDVFYLDSISTLFKKGVLVVESEKVNIDLGIVEKNPNAKTEGEIATLLKGNFLKMKKELSFITEPYAKDLVYFVAKSVAQDLNGLKLKYISEFCGRSILVDEIDE